MKEDLIVKLTSNKDDHDVSQTFASENITN